MLRGAEQLLCNNLPTTSVYRYCGRFEKSLKFFTGTIHITATTFAPTQYRMSFKIFETLFILLYIAYSTFKNLLKETYL
jgi:hypothetical protein